MEPKPVQSYPTPSYPTRRGFLSGSGAALLAAGCVGCSDAVAATPVVAPVFEHGDGRGATGCVVVSPPVFLSAEEALQVIKEGRAKEGIQLGAGLPLGEVTVEHIDPWRQANEQWMGKERQTITKPVQLAGVDREQRVGVEFISVRDCHRFSGPAMSTVSSYDTKDLAKKLGEEIRDQCEQDLRVGLFYDPLESWSFEDATKASDETDEQEDFRARFERLEETAKDKSKALLRRQAQAFVTWLKKQ
jgi:hypothetical protein